MDLKFDDNGLIVAIAQDAVSGEVLMQAYMNKEAYDKTVETGYATYYSRSRGKLWMKGEQSGHTQKVLSIAYDCDGDALLLKVIQEGAACHTGNRTCFYRSLSEDNYPLNGIIYDVIATIKDRRENPKDGSYTNYLFDKGLDKILKKIGEETAEVIIAAKNNDKKELVMEICDLIYHTLVLMNEKDIRVTDIFEELLAREGRAPKPKYLKKN
ncbi:MAG: bifunctional phosphoribosyl-AMP cyclohydrolase/phosphoribosyl-ATP diphosphatase HisIE [Christensenellales bacterium]|jgi:phosphoribosyl-ATP pyrophosphohydrolase/phosphoribosyl-AMP cyclohydrolase